MSEIPDYSQFAWDELLRLACEKDQLTDEARLALDSELQRRSIATTEITGYQAELEKRAAEEERKVREMYAFRGTIARKLLGKRNTIQGLDKRTEEFTTTLWFSFFWIPVFPISSYRIRRGVRQWWQFWRAGDYEVLEKLSRDWEQILITCIKTAIILLILRFTVPWLLEMSIKH